MKTTKQTSQYKGVTLHKPNGKWKAYIDIDGRKQHLGYFIKETDAAKAYDKAAKHCFGEYARFNFPEKLEAALHGID